jgi:capsule polysaccharide modification protein KpsS
MRTKIDPYAPEVCDERRRRIRVALAALAYEQYSDSIMTDAAYDKLARSINPAIRTGRCDDFFANTFQPWTGSWIWSHPELDGIDAILRRVWPNIGAASADED